MAFAVLHNASLNPTQSGELKALFSHGKPRPDANSVRGSPWKNKAFYSPETQRNVAAVIRPIFFTYQTRMLSSLCSLID